MRLEITEFNRRRQDSFIPLTIADIEDEPRNTGLDKCPTPENTPQTESSVGIVPALILEWLGALQAETTVELIRFGVCSFPQRSHPAGELRFYRLFLGKPGFISMP